MGNMNEAYGTTAEGLDLEIHHNSLDEAADEIKPITTKLDIPEPGCCFLCGNPIKEGEGADCLPNVHLDCI